MANHHTNITMYSNNNNDILQGSPRTTMDVSSYNYKNLSHDVKGMADRHQQWREAANRASIQSTGIAPGHSIMATSDRRFRRSKLERTKSTTSVGIDEEKEKRKSKLRRSKTSDTVPSKSSSSSLSKSRSERSVTQSQRSSSTKSSSPEKKRDQEENGKLPRHRIGKKPTHNNTEDGIFWMKSATDESVKSFREMKQKAKTKSGNFLVRPDISDTKKGYAKLMALTESTPGLY